jgi:hypothetical protein
VTFARALPRLRPGAKSEVDLAEVDRHERALERLRDHEAANPPEFTTVAHGRVDPFGRSNGRRAWERISPAVEIHRWQLPKFVQRRAADKGIAI